jgi:hypothetical protein
MPVPVKSFDEMHALYYYALGKKRKAATCVRVFKNIWFSRFAHREAISDRDLCEAISRAERGLIDADLGGGVIKQRIARPNEGRSGGFRSIILFRAGERAFFVYGFAKNRKANLSADELKDYRRAAQITLAFDETALENAIKQGELIEVFCNEKI